MLYRLPFQIALVFLGLPLLSNAQIESDWKVFRAAYVYDGKYNASEKLENDAINDVAVTREGKVYIAVAGNGLKTYEEGKINQVRAKGISANDRIQCLEIDQKGILWAGGNMGLFALEGNAWVERTPEKLGFVKEVVVSNDGQIFATGWSSDAINRVAKGLYHFDGSEWHVFIKENSEMPSNFIDRLCLDKEGNLWASYGRQDDGLIKFKDGEIRIINSDNSGLPSSHVRDIKCLDDGTVVFATPKGLAKLKDEKWEIESLVDLFKDPILEKFNLGNLIQEPDLLSFTIDNEGTIWIGTVGQGLIMKGKNGTMILKRDNSPLTSDFVHKVYVDRQNRKWILTGFVEENLSDMLLRSIPEGPRFQGMVMFKEADYAAYPKWTIYNGHTAPIEPGGYYSLNVDREGYVWTNYQAVSFARYKEGQFNIFEGMSKSIQTDMISSISAGPDGKIYGGSNLKGVYVLDKTEVEVINGANSGLSNGNTTCVLKSKKFLYVGHVAGFDTYDGDTWKQYRKRDGLPGSYVYCIYEDSKGDAWIGTNKGLVKFSKGKFTVYNKKTKDLPNNNIQAICEDANGTIWIGHRRGVSKFDGTKWTDLEEFAGLRKPTIQSLSVGPNNSLAVGTYSEGLAILSSGEWQLFTAENSGVYQNKIINLRYAADGSLYIVCGEQASFTQTKPSSYYTANSTTPPDVIELEKKIANFDPKSAFVIFKQ